MSTQPSRPASKTTSFLVLLAVMLLAGPFLYTILGKSVFIVSPAWWAKALLPTLVGAFIVATLAFLFLFRKTKNHDEKKKRVLALITGPFVAAVMVAVFVLWSLPVVMAKISSTPVSYEMTVDSTKRYGKARCDYPFSLREISQRFCAADAAAHKELRPGTKIEVSGMGNQWGLFVDGYRVLK